MNYDDRFMDNHICHSELVSESYKNKNLDPVQGTPSPEGTPLEGETNSGGHI